MKHKRPAGEVESAAVSVLTTPRLSAAFCFSTKRRKYEIAREQKQTFPHLLFLEGKEKKDKRFELHHFASAARLSGDVFQSQKTKRNRKKMTS